MQKKICKNIERFKSVYKIKDESYEDIILSEVFDISKQAIIKGRCPASSVRSIKNAIISADSDIVLVDNLVSLDKGVIEIGDYVLWDKYFSPCFFSMIPRDANCEKYDLDTVTIKEYANIVYVRGTCVSLLGTFAHIWAHFILQFVSKLYFAKCADLLDEGTTVIIPKYGDSHIIQAIYDYLNGTNVKIIIAENDTYYCCENLMHIPSAMDLANDGHVVLPYYYNYSKENLQGIRDVLIRPYENRYINNGHSDKIYLVRRNVGRTLVNWPEVEQWFLGKGFELVEPHKLSLEEKVAIFENARIVCGPGSSAFVNIIWCKENTKILTFSNYPRLIDPGIGALVRLKKSKCMYVSGIDINAGPHASYMIPISRIEQAYEQLCSE